MRAHIVSFTVAVALAGAALSGCPAKVTTPDDVDLLQMMDMAHGPIDLSEPADIAKPPPDIAMPMDPPDLAMADMVDPPPDLAKPPDFAAGPPPDMAMQKPDMVMQDFTMPPDFAGPDLGCSMTCNSPPPAMCMANNLIFYSQNGTCMNGTCSYTSMMAACMFGCYKAACTAALSFIGNTASFQTGTGNQVGLFNGTAPSTNSVSAITQTFPHGSAKEVHLIYSLNDSMFKNPVDLLMMPDPNAPMGNNDQWYAIIPKQPSGTKVTWYVRADPYSGNALYDSGNGQNFTYTSQ